MSSDKESSSPFSSLSYEILLVFGYYYFLLYIGLETLLLFFKKFYFLYPLGNLLSELALLFFVFGIENIRIFLGKKGNLTERTLCIFISLLLTFPIASASIYFFLYQTYVIIIDVILSIIFFVVIGLQSLFAVFTLISVGR